MVLVCDQAIYAKAMEIVWKHHDIFKPIVLHLGAFHTSHTFMAVVSTVVSEVSVISVIEGMRYNRYVRTNKLLYEAFMRTIWKEFLAWLVEDSGSSNDISHFNESLEDFV